MKTTDNADPERDNHRMRGLLAVSAVALIAGGTLAPSSSAMPTGSGVRAGKNVAVFHNLDFVAAFGYPIGKPMTVEVFRNGVEIGSATGPAVATPEGGGIEVNHGPEGAPRPGDCWTRTTPDIRPGDRIVVSGDGGSDKVLVDNIAFTRGPIDDRSTADPSDVYIEGRASFADGTPIPIPRLDSGELRQGDPRFRANPNEVERIPATRDGWRATYKAPYKIFQIKVPLTPQQQKDAIHHGDHAMGYGHVFPLPAETQLVEGLGGGGPALGCEGSPVAVNALTASSRKIVNARNVSKGLELSGVSKNASAISVRLNDKNPATRPLTAEAEPSSASGAQTWKVTFPSGTEPGVRGVADLRDGILTARGSYTVGGATVRGANLKLIKDTRAPNAPKAKPRPGTYRRTKFVLLKTKSAANTIRFTLNGKRPTRKSRVAHRRIRVGATQKIKAIAIDKAGNRSRVASLKYVIRK
ncbi:MAG: chitobiase/beta-hexosaminidase C-terminal domain-containing protein [Actinomycetota bacterium]